MKETQTRRTRAAGGGGPSGRVSAIDWAEVHRRLEAAAEALSRGRTPTPAETRRILRARAAALAREAEEAPRTGEHLEILEFLLAHERYGIETRFVREVYPLREFTPVPGAPRFVLGAVNVRGQILTVVDIRKLFDLPEKGLTDLNKVIVLRRDKMVVGVLADAVLGFGTVPLSGLEPSLPTLTGIRAEFLRGVTRDRLVVLEVEKILSGEGLLVTEQGEG